jgi:hypothetical protein
VWYVDEESGESTAWTTDELRDAVLFPALTYLNLDGAAVHRFECP